MQAVASNRSTPRLSRDISTTVSLLGGLKVLGPHGDTTPTNYSPERFIKTMVVRMPGMLTVVSDCVRTI